MRLVSERDPRWSRPGLGSRQSAAILQLDPYTPPAKVRRDIMKKIRLDQNGPDWLAWRRKGIGASESAAVVGMNPWQSADDIADLKTGRKQDFEGNKHTERGKRLEPEARERYEQLMGWGMEPCCGLHDRHDFIRASLDGVREDGGLILEIKAPSIKWHRHVIEEGIPDWYFCQVQHQLLVTGAPRAHFVSYCPSRVLSEEQSFILLNVDADLPFQRFLEERLCAFWAEVQASLSSSPRRTSGSKSP
jgi:putative phage-type endonuclease